MRLESRFFPVFSVLVLVVAGCLAAHAQLPPELRERLRAGSDQISFTRQVGSAALLGDPKVPMIEVLVNGGTRLNFLLDFGANVVSVKKSAAQKLQAQVLHPVDEREIIELASIEFGGVVIRNIVAVSVPQLGVDGVLGFNLFREGFVTLDYPGRTFTWEQRRESAPDSQQTCMSYQLRSRMPFVPVNVGDKTLLFNLDTGATGWFIVPQSMESELPFAGPARPGPQVWNERTGRTSTIMRRLDVDLRLGKFTVPRPWLMLDPALEEDDLLLGSGFLQHFHLELDIAQRCVAMHQQTPFSSPPRPPDEPARMTE